MAKDSRKINGLVSWERMFFIAIIVIQFAINHWFGADEKIVNYRDERITEIKNTQIEIKREIGTIKSDIAVSKAIQERLEKKQAVIEEGVNKLLYRVTNGG